MPDISRDSRAITNLFTALVLGALCGCGGTSVAVDSESNADPTDVEPEVIREGEDWPIFLGLQETGISSETGLASEWPPSGPPILWEREIGTGYSAPSVRGNRLVVHHRLADEEVVECLRADNGKPLWKYSYPSRFADPYGYNNGPRCTPLLTPQHCYTHGAEGMLVCLDLASGKKIWQRDTKAEFDLPDWFFGVGCTPILEDNLLIVIVGGQPNSGVVAFHAETGETVWESVGKQTWDGAETRGEWIAPTYKWTGEEKIASYSSPLAATVHGKRHILCLMRQGLVSLDPKDGSENFKYWFRSRINDSVNAARPLVIDDKILLSAAYKVGSAMIQVSPDGKSIKQLWRDHRNLLTHWSTPLHVEGYIYGFSGRHEREGSLNCLDVETGKLVWETKGFEGDLNNFQQDPATGDIIDTSSGEKIPFPFFGRGSKIKVEDKFIILGERGTLVLAKINPGRYEEISRSSYSQIHYPAWAAPVLSRKRLYLRSEDALLCLDLAEEAFDN